VLLPQKHAWNFNAFELYSRTHGNPLVTITVTLLETYELLVSARALTLPKAGALL
jgi:hypothetical protein